MFRCSEGGGGAVAGRMARPQIEIEGVEAEAAIRLREGFSPCRGYHHDSDVVAGQFGLGGERVFTRSVRSVML